MKKRNLIILFAVSLLLIGIRTEAQFKLQYSNETGAILSIVNPNDAYKMNWVFSSADIHPSWQQSNQDWGLGKYRISNSDKDIRWNIPDKRKQSDQEISLLYKTRYLNVEVKREQVDD